MKEAGWIWCLQPRTLYWDPFGETVEPDQVPDLTPDEQDVVSGVALALGRGYRPFLLKGVTGLTELCLQLSDRMIQKGRSVLVSGSGNCLDFPKDLSAVSVPVPGNAAVLHSGLSNGERLDQLGPHLGAAFTPIVIGTRSAVLAPLEQHRAHCPVA